MEIRYREEALRDLEACDRELQAFFLRHIEKLASMPPRRHLKYGIPYHVEDVTRHARLIIEIEGDALYVIRCFARHKDYERWYKSYR